MGGGTPRRLHCLLGEQRRHSSRQRDVYDARRGLARRDQHVAERFLLRHAQAAAEDDATQARRQDCEHVIAVGTERYAGSGELQRRQGCPHRSHEGAGFGDGCPQRHGERRGPGLHRDRHDPRAAAGRAEAVSAHEAFRTPRGGGRIGEVPAVGRCRLHHRRSN